MTRTLNIAHCIHGLGLGGAQRIVRSLISIRHPQPSRCYVYCSVDGPFRKGVEKQGATVRILPRYLLKFDPLWVVRLARAFRKDRIDLVHTHLFGDSLHGYLAARLASKLPVVMTIHGELESYNQLQRRGYRWLLPRCARPIACSDSARDSFARTGWPGTERIQSIPNGIDPPQSRSLPDKTYQDLRCELGAPPSGTLLAAIGRLAPEKGHRFLISALAEIARTTPTPPSLIFLGEGPLRAELERQAHSEGIDHLVLFAGFRNDVIAILPAIDIVVFSSLYEGLPLALLEAMATARCILGTEIPGLLNAVRPDREALLVPAGDVAQLAHAIGRAVSDPGLRQRLGEEARRRFFARFTADRMLQSYALLQREVLAERGVNATI